MCPDLAQRYDTRLYSMYVIPNSSSSKFLQIAYCLRQHTWFCFEHTLVSDAFATNHIEVFGCPKWWTCIMSSYHIVKGAPEILYFAADFVRGHVKHSAWVWLQLLLQADVLRSAASKMDWGMKSQTSVHSAMCIMSFWWNWGQEHCSYEITWREPAYHKQVGSSRKS